MRKALTVTLLLLALTAYSSKQNSGASSPANQMSAEPSQVSVTDQTSPVRAQNAKRPEVPVANNSGGETSGVAFDKVERG